LDRVQLRLRSSVDLRLKTHLPVFLPDSNASRRESLAQHREPIRATVSWFEDQTHTGLAQVLWTEYVVERTRRAIANELAWGFADVENEFVVEQMQDIEREVPGLIRWAVQTTSLHNAYSSSGTRWRVFTR
jgi:hypothetical protein